jgi:DNA-directed RNA polymerase specialized sigma24 family protein
MKYCEHKFLMPPEFNRRQSAADCVAFGKLSPFCVHCWQRQGKEVPEEYRTEIGRPLVYGHCDLITQVARKRGFARDSASREDIEGDLRLHLMEKQKEIEAGIAGKTEEHVRNYVRRVLQNLLKDTQQKSSAGLVIRNTVKSLTPEGLIPTSRKQAARERAGELLTDLTGGDAASIQDDYTLDESDALVVESPDSEPKKSTNGTEARILFDTMVREASSQIATLTGGRKDGFDVHLDLQKVLSRLPDDERSVFSWLWLENGELLSRARSYPDVQRELNLSLQSVRTLEMKAIQKLKPALGPSFFKRR